MKISALLTMDESSGDIECLWTDELPLEALGSLKVRRASSIEFNEQMQQWEVRLAENPNVVVFTHPLRMVCVNWEIETINRQLLSK